MLLRLDACRFSKERKKATLCHNNTHVLHLPPGPCPFMGVCVCVCITLFNSMPCGRCPTDARAPPLLSSSATRRGLCPLSQCKSYQCDCTSLHSTSLLFTVLVYAPLLSTSLDSKTTLTSNFFFYTVVGES